jgi:hypothetical protein
LVPIPTVAPPADVPAEILAGFPNVASVFAPGRASVSAISKIFTIVPAGVADLFPHLLTLFAPIVAPALRVRTVGSNENKAKCG